MLRVAPLLNDPLARRAEGLGGSAPNNRAERWLARSIHARLRQVPIRGYDKPSAGGFAPRPLTGL